MQYVGGKSRIAKEISNMVISGGGTFVSLFCGGCSVEELAAQSFERVICNDLHPYLIAMWRGVQKGYVLPDKITREEYYYIKSHKDENPVLAGFAGFGCAFGGNWFSGYAVSKDKPDGYAKQSKNVVLRQMRSLRNAEFICGDYRAVTIPEGAVVYADPPYANVGTGYKTGAFDSNAFWAYMRLLSQRHLVYISEQTAPEDFVPIWQKQIRRELCRDKQKLFTVTEKLYVHNTNYTI